MSRGHVADTVRGMNLPSSARPTSPLPAAGAPSAAVLAQVADALAWPLLLVQADGILLHANAAARCTLRQGSLLRLSADRRVEPGPSGRRAEFAAVLAAAPAAAQRVLQWVDGDPPCTASIAALAADGAGRVPVLVALSVAGTGAASARAYASLHGLSGAETRVLERLALGDNSRRAAAALGVTPATVRSHVVALRRKTGHATVAALLQTLAALPPLAPLVAHREGEPEGD
jgi:DNA-binding CsgD family transcriptional regulator